MFDKKFVDRGKVRGITLLSCKTFIKLWAYMNYNEDRLDIFAFALNVLPYRHRFYELEDF